MTHQQLLAALLPEAYGVSEQVLSVELSAEGQALDKSYAYSGDVINGITPFYAKNLLADWERVLGLTPLPDTTYQQRIENVLSKIRAVGGLSINYFISLAKKMGYTITIDEYEPFRAGINRVGDTIYSKDILWVWRINLKDLVIPAYKFMAGVSVAGERLTMFGDAVIESMFNELKPAHTYVYFTYSNTEIGLLYYDGIIAADGSYSF
ncbi:MULTISPECIES: YmfQ family protein [Serratia]|uniref:YmfQ family protein n=1 Tax=Serratia TaxID=613 RepID=UPI00141CDF35|nr:MULTISPECIES: putative phage tail protein [Serratia]MBP1128922.1 uncharacterized protein YmfQ (DUF2313 family) [Serratia sp. PL17]CAB1206782.1 hypothetical protein FB6_0056 [Serratia marcescens]